MLSPRAEQCDTVNLELNQIHIGFNAEISEFPARPIAVQPEPQRKTPPDRSDGV
jgi:hypothetical protein